MKTSKEYADQLVTARDGILRIGTEEVVPDNVEGLRSVMTALIERMQLNQKWTNSEDVRRVACYLREKSFNVEILAKNRAKLARAAAYMELAYAELIEIPNG